MLLGTDGTKMSKSRGNAIALARRRGRDRPADRGAKTDAERTSPTTRSGGPRSSGLLLIAALCTGANRRVADDIGARGAAALKALVTEAVNEDLRPLRQRRRELAGDPGYLARCSPRATPARTRSPTETLGESASMGMWY